MKRISLVFLQIVVVLIGLSALVFMLWEPHFEGRNVNATFFQVYFNDLFLVYAYAASIPFFVAVYNAFKALGYVGQGKAFSQATVKAVRTIRRCALLLVGLVALPAAYLFIVRPDDDIAGGVAIGLMVIFTSTVVAAGADVLVGVLRSGVDVKL